MKRILAVIVALVLVPSAAARAAQPAEQAAEEHLARGVALRRQGQTEQALVEFQRAHAAAPSGRTLAQIGLAEQALKRWVEAEQHLAEALEDSSPWVQMNRKALGDSLGKVRQHVGNLVVRGPDGARVSVNGRDVGLLPHSDALRVGEGEVSVVVSRPGKRDFTQWITIQGEGTHTVSVPLEAALAEPLPAPRDDTMPLKTVAPSEDNGGSSWSARRLTGAALLAVGIASLAVGATLFFLDGKDLCNPEPGFACDRHRASSTPGLVLVGAGLGAGITGGLLLRESKAGANLGVNAGTLSATVSARF